MKMRVIACVVFGALLGLPVMGLRLPESHDCERLIAGLRKCNTQPLAGGAAVQARARWMGVGSRISASDFRRILTEAEWRAFWREHSGPEDPPEVDFAANMVLAYLQRLNAGHWIHEYDVEICERPDELRMVAYIYCSHAREGADDTVYGFAVVPRSAKPVEFWMGHYDWAPPCSRYVRMSVVPAVGR